MSSLARKVPRAGCCRRGQAVAEVGIEVLTLLPCKGTAQGKLAFVAADWRLSLRVGCFSQASARLRAARTVTNRKQLSYHLTSRPRGISMIAVFRACALLVV